RIIRLGLELVSKADGPGEKKKLVSHNKLGHLHHLLCNSPYIQSRRAGQSIRGDTLIRATPVYTR
ncbi:hypothetical protein, partial [Klebsiella pneumoniae]|uniref:hypothetical protein n=1 Tax=Klebsiella pneumoniae TaxID=573 RepID=UPI004055413D